MNCQLLHDQGVYLSDRLKKSTILVAGATGLIGSRIVYYLMWLNDKYHSDIKVMALYRNAEKKDKVFADILDRDDLVFVFTKLKDICDIEGAVDYIIHSAGISGGTKMHLKDPKKVFETSYDTTRCLLDLGVKKQSKRFVYVSSYEVYGTPIQDKLIKETDVCNLDTMELRNIYAECKRFCESMLVAYSKQYSLPVCSGRLTSTFGNGVSYDDPRFFAEFARCAIEGRDIILKSTGGTIRSYLDADDAAAAFLYMLADGENQTVYNLTNMENRISIKEIAEKIVDISDMNISLKFEITEDTSKFGFRKEGCTLMDASRLMELGWKPVYSMEDTLLKLITSMRKNQI